MINAIFSFANAHMMDCKKYSDGKTITMILFYEQEYCGERLQEIYYTIKFSERVTDTCSTIETMYGQFALCNDEQELISKLNAFETEA